MGIEDLNNSCFHGNQYYTMNSVKMKGFNYFNIVKNTAEHASV